MGSNGGHKYMSSPCRKCEKFKFCEDNCGEYIDWRANLKNGFILYKTSLPNLGGRMVRCKL